MSIFFVVAVGGNKIHDDEDDEQANIYIPRASLSTPSIKSNQNTLFLDERRREKCKAIIVY